MSISDNKVDKFYDLNQLYDILPRLDALEQQNKNISNISPSPDKEGTYIFQASSDSNSDDTQSRFTEIERLQNHKRVRNDWLQVLENKMPPYIRRIYQGKLTYDLLESEDYIKLPYELRRWLDKYNILLGYCLCNYHSVRDFILEYFLDVMVFRVTISYTEFIDKYCQRNNSSTKRQFYLVLELLKSKRLINKFVLKKAENKSQRQCNFYEHLRAKPEDLQNAIDDYVDTAKGFSPKEDPDPPPPIEEVIEDKANKRNIREKAKLKSQVDLIEDKEFQNTKYEVNTAQQAINTRIKVNSNKLSLQISQNRIEDEKIPCAYITITTGGYEQKCDETAHQVCRFCNKSMCGICGVQHEKDNCGKPAIGTKQFKLLDYNKVENSFLLTAGENQKLLE